MGVIDQQTRLHMVNTPQSLNELIQALEDVDQIALDTEFHAERRYRPELMLLQLATDRNTVWLADPQTIDLASLGPALSDKVWLMHGGRHDLEILDTTLQARPRKIFDTQPAAGLLGHHFPDRLSRLVERFLSLDIDKGSTLSDWSSRPLSRQQRQYAAEDALILFPLVNALQEALQAEGRLEWAWQASAELLDETLNPPPVRDEWRTWGVAGRLSPTERTILAALLEWREKIARQTEKPPHFVLSNSLLIGISRQKPTRMRQLRENRRLHRGFLKHHGEDLLVQIKNARAQDEEGPPLNSAQLAQVVLLDAWTRREGGRLGIHPGLLLPERWRRRLVREGAQALEGWRGMACGERLEEFFGGKRSVGFQDFEDI
ncbi:MAG: ribonuclease D [Myxococcota bacterium]